MASFTYAVRYWITAACITPLRSSGADGTADSILCHRDGQAFLQGTSLAGAMRNWLADSGEIALAQQLFGSQEQSSQLLVSDGEFSPESAKQLRPRLKINGRSGSAEDKHKFDVAHIPVDSTFDFSLTWMAFQSDDTVLSAIERILAALHNGEILLGAQKTNGFGRVHIEKAVRQHYDLRSSADRTAWMTDEQTGTPLHLADTSNSKQVVFTLTGHTSSILVKAASAKHGNVKSFTPNLTENGKAILPGSSIKGSVRARVSAISQFLHLDENVVDDIFGRSSKNNDNGKAGLIRFEDAALPERKYTISRIRIDKFTGGVFGNGLFQEEPHSGEITLKIHVPSDQPVACALLLFALRDLGLGFYNLGSDWAVGRGHIAVRDITIQTPAGDTAALRFGKDGSCTVEDSQNIVKSWISALEAVRHEV